MTLLLCVVTPLTPWCNDDPPLNLDSTGIQRISEALNGKEDKTGNVTLVDLDISDNPKIGDKGGDRAKAHSGCHAACLPEATSATSTLSP